eukprot:gnl/TRDRNA2_/TRDRNA2_60637_c0_seq1.p1 gnl/TRDRNA2_/TRDRNA2_60637_c0~~gnl/TRDRNA2_/TRDRNA2_60637_c0_seq1.p1  ORF type:complete len:122 (-),score=10.69 gnl/TRDRNA2_/TRDRNA2_60637_c0_seq1:329-694(-)
MATVMSVFAAVVATIAAIDEKCDSNDDEISYMRIPKVVNRTEMSNMSTSNQVGRNSPLPGADHVTTETARFRNVSCEFCCGRRRRSHYEVGHACHINRAGIPYCTMEHPLEDDYCPPAIID